MTTQKEWRHGSRNPARTAEMKRLKLEEGLTHKQIAERFGVTAQRVSEILGHSGFGIPRRYRMKFVKDHSDLADSELAEILKVKARTIAKYRKAVTQ